MRKKIIGNSTITPVAIPDWEQTDETKVNFIKNKPDFKGLEKKVTTLENRVFQTPITTIPTTLEANQKYNFGECSELGLIFPTTANDGDVIYLTFTSGAAATTLTIDTTNTCDIEVIPETNTGYEIYGMFNGDIWIINYSEYTVSEG